MNWLTYLPLALLAALIISSAVYAFFWASKNGEFRDLEGQSRSIFDAAEPEGMPTDFFPGKAPKLAARASDKFQGPGSKGNRASHPPGADSRALTPDS